jgi:hypothetical protein
LIAEFGLTATDVPVASEQILARSELTQDVFRCPGIELRNAVGDRLPRRLIGHKRMRLRLLGKRSIETSKPYSQHTRRSREIGINWAATARAKRAKFSRRRLEFSKSVSATMQMEVPSTDWGICCVRCAASLAAASAMTITELAGLFAEFKIDISAEATALIHSQSPGPLLDDKFSTSQNSRTGRVATPPVAKTRHGFHRSSKLYALVRTASDNGGAG